MRNIYSGIDIGSDSIKIVAGEYVNGNFNILAAVSRPSNGVRRGLIIDSALAIESLNEALKEIEEILGMAIKKAIITVPSNDRELTVVESKIPVLGEFVTGFDISKVLEESTIGKVKEDHEIVSVVPIMFTIDETRHEVNPNGIKADTLTVKALLATAPKKQIFDYLKVVSNAGVEVIDITFGCIGDYYEVRDNNTDKEIGSIINIGRDKTEISVFNKGILIKSSIINLGSKNIDKDISYVYEIDVNSAREIKETFSSASRRYADATDTIDLISGDGNKTTVSSMDVTEVVEARFEELLNLAKKEINNLTKRKISYIIVTGGVTELYGVNSVVENTLGIEGRVHNAKTPGIRDNKYTSATGICRYFHDKMLLREREVSFADSEDIEQMMSNKKSMIELTDNTFISKIHNYFANN